MRAPTTATGLPLSCLDGFNRVRLRPYFLCRVSGIPAERVLKLRRNSLRTLVERVQKCDAVLDSLRLEVSDILFNVVGHLAAGAARSAVLHLRRDLFNLRLPSASQLEAVSSVLPTQAADQCATFVGLLTSRSNLEGELIGEYTTARVEERLLFQDATHDEDFTRGLLVASNSLFADLGRYQRASATALTRKEEHVERSLLRYFTRAAMKATPFASFCTIIPGFFDLPSAHGSSVGLAAQCEPIWLDGDLVTKRTFARLNKQLARMLWAYCKTQPGIRNRLQVELSPTLAIVDGVARYLASDGRHEIVQRLAVTEALGIVLACLRELGGVPLERVIEELCAADGLECTPDEAREYVERLLGIGMLRFRTGTHEHSADWNVELSANLRAFEDNQARSLASWLDVLGQQVTSYSTAPLIERVSTAGELRRQVALQLASLGMNDAELRGLTFYEDATADAEMRISMTLPVANAVDRLAEWIQLMLPLLTPHAEQATMRAVFDRFYGPSTRAVPLIEFYEMFCREHFKDHLRRVKEKFDRARAEGPSDATSYDVENPLAIDSVRRARAAWSLISEAIARRWGQNPDTDEIVLRREELEQALQDVDRIVPRHVCVGAFCQPAVDQSGGSGAVRLVVPNGLITTGYGKYLSRFLYMLPDELHRRVVADNDGDGEWYAELTSGLPANANIHAPLVPWEISYPAVDCGNSTAQIDVCELDVVPDERPHRVFLVHRETRTPVVPLDLGFITGHARPLLFQLLSWFAPMRARSLTLPGQPLQPGAPNVGTKTQQESLIPTNISSTSASPPTRPPRITYEQSLVLARQSWVVSCLVVPKRAKGEEEAKFFHRLNAWRTTHGIPEQVYVRLEAETYGKIRQVLELDSVDDTHDASPQDTVPSAELGAQNGSSVSDGAIGDPLSDHDRSGSPTRRRSDHVRSSANMRTRQQRSDMRKPQFIDFVSPLLVDLFARLTATRQQSILVMEECLPAPADLLPHDGDQWATEIVLQFDVWTDVHQGRARENRFGARQPQLATDVQSGS